MLNLFKGCDNIMEYFNTYTPAYVQSINSYHNSYRIKVELLGYYENVIGDITKDLSVDADGQININYEPIVRRSCSLTMINVEKKYTPNPNNPFWFERKFKLWIGVVNQFTGDIYWWAQGVFFTQSANSDGNVVKIEGIDKGGALNGSLGMNIADSQYKIKTGSIIGNLICDTLMLNMYRQIDKIPYSSGKPIDPVVPIIDIKFYGIKTEREISIDANNCIGDIFQQINEGYNADLYYDINGHFQVTELIDGNRTDGYKYMASQWDFSDDNSFYGLSNFTYNFDGKNAVMVYTAQSDKENYSYSAYNNNPASPLRVGLCGVRRMDSQEIPLLDVSPEEMTKRCKDYADYLLIKETLRGATVSFDSPIIPHLDVNRTITITDKQQGFDRETFVVQSITIPLAATTMSITATSMNWLPTNFDIEGFGA